MKKLALFVSFALVAGIASAHDEAKKADAAKPAEAAKPADAAKPATVAAEKAPAGKTHEVTAEVVSTDAAKSTITIKGEKDNKTVPVDAKAAASLATVKAGDKVALTCWDDDKGAHVKVVAIAPAKVAAPEKK